MNRTNSILLAVLITNLLPTIAAGHGAIPLGLLELLTFYSAITMNFEEFPLFSFWTLAALLMIIGQIFIVLAIKSQYLTINRKFGRLGTLILLTPLIIIASIAQDHLWTVLIVTSIPFLVLTIVLWWRTTINKASVSLNGT